MTRRQCFDDEYTNPRKKGSSKDIPPHQRRGAILVLGMLAAAKPEIVSEHIDLLLKIGLGQLGKVCPRPPRGK